MTITQIQQQRHNEKRYSIFVDGEFVFGLSDVDVLYYKLVEQMDISTHQFEYIRDEVVFVQARDKAFHYLGYQARTEKQLRTKLAEQDFSEEIIEKVVALAKNYDYINDETYARDFVASKTKFQKLGQIRIKQELRERGISDDISAKALATRDTDELPLALVHLEKKTRGETQLDDKEKKRCFDYLLRRGFSFDVANRALKAHTEQ